MIEVADVERMLFENRLGGQLRVDQVGDLPRLICRFSGAVRFEAVDADTWSTIGWRFEAPLLLHMLREWRYKSTGARPPMILRARAIAGLVGERVHLCANCPDAIQLKSSFAYTHVDGTGLCARRFPDTAHRFAGRRTLCPECGMRESLVLRQDPWYDVTTCTADGCSYEYLRPIGD